MDFRCRNWCCWGGLNSRPHPYQGCALPLSYSSRPKGRAPIVMRLRNVKPSLRNTAFTGKAFPMGEERRGTVPREERLAAKLRENLRRRKAQARALDQDE